jgi:anti-sigma B factor antagonist
VALRLKELGHGHLHIVHCGARSHELLHGLGLDQLFDIHGNGATAPECQRLSAETAAASHGGEKRERARTMLEAHEALCEAAPENLPRFKDVLDYLKQDLHQKTASK